jgi:1,4-dihydroxy-2-naphthoate octaprenyltransferase
MVLIDITIRFINGAREDMSIANAAKLLKMIRIHIVVGGFLAFSLGALLALANGGNFNPAVVISAYVVVLLGDLSSHYSNDYFDIEVDRNIEQKKFFSGRTILVSYPNLRSVSITISVLLLISANALAIAIFLLLGTPIEIFLVILVASLLGWVYSAPPARLSSRGFGELVVASVTGFAIPAIGYLAVKSQFDPLFVYLAFPFVMYGLMLILSLESPDAVVDLKGGKRTLVVRKGVRNVFIIILALTVSATLTFFAYYWMITPAVLNIGILAVFSFAPLASALAGFAGVLQKRSLKKFSGLNIVSLFIFNILTITYLLTIVFGT